MSTTEIMLALMMVIMIGGFAVLIYQQKRLLDAQESRRDEESRDETIDAILTGVRCERQEVQQAVINTERSISQSMTSLMAFVTEQQNKSAAEVRALNETARTSLGETNQVMHRQLLALQALVDERFARIIETNAASSEAFGSRLDAKFTDIRTSVETSLEKMRTVNETKLEEMRSTVQEKLDKTLAERLSMSFRTVDEKLGLVQSGLGEMRQMAQSVRDLKGVLTNVKTRGTFGETQLSVILGDILTPGQYAEQVRVVPGSSAVADFAVRMPGAGDAPCWLPIDSKFPLEDYQRLQAAETAGDAQGAQKARAGLERAVFIQAKSIREKYVRPPYTTEFAVMFLPSEGLYAEVIRIPGLFERLQREWRITPAGPAVVSALINSLQMGFVTLALQERSAEVWQILGEVKGEFLQFAEGFAKVQKKFSEAQSSLDAMQTRQNVMQKKMTSIEAVRAAIPQTEPAALASCVSETDAASESKRLN